MTRITKARTFGIWLALMVAWCFASPIGMALRNYLGL